MLKDHGITTGCGASNILALALLLLLTVGIAPAGAQQFERSEPIYNPDTKSYFQFFTDNRIGTWDAAQRLALTKIYKGVQGRLAIIDSEETNDFVIDSFGLRNRHLDVWIGLRYWCKVRMLQWEGKRMYSPSDLEHYGLWHNPWNRDGSTCDDFRSTRLGYMPVYYRTVGSLTRWQATTASKGFSFYLVEYPTGQE